MSYFNYIDHPRYGRLWFEMTLRNWWGLYNSEEKNLSMGPCIEIVARDYALVGSGETIEEAIQNLQKLLDWYADDNMTLPENVKPVRSSLKNRFRWWRTRRRLEREKKLCRITKDTGR